MNRDSYLSIVLAVCCISAAGIASTTLASSLSQDPDDVVDVDYSSIPIGEDDGESIKGAVENEQQSESTGGGDGDESSSSSSSEPDDGGGAAANQPDPSGDEGSSGGETNEPGGTSGVSSGETGSAGSGVGEAPGALSLLQQLWNLLEQLLPWLVLLVVLALAYRYRRHLLALALAVAAVVGDRTESRGGTDAPWPSEQPSNEVHRAWVSMVDRLDIDRPQTRTPSECASAAVEADMDPTAVRTLTDVFEEVRYGEKPVTDERRQRARDGLRGLGGGETR